MSLSALLKQRALEIGFDLAGIAPLAAWQDLEFSRKWVEQGFGGQMQYLHNPKRHDPRRLLPTAKSVICVGLIYNTDYPYSTELQAVRCQASAVRHHAHQMPEQERQGRNGVQNNGQQTTNNGRAKSSPGGWISRYAWGRDYHQVMRPMLKEFCAAIEAEAPGTETRAFVDTGAIVERAFGRYSGMGWIGKNTCLINQEKGSWFFLGVILTTLELDPDFPAPDRCGSCMRCLEACPTGALTEPYVMDATRCISYFTIELKGSIPEGFRAAIGANIFGCDICQDVCPWNSRQPSIASVESKKSDQPAGASPQPRIIGTTSRREFQPMLVTLDRALPEDSETRRKPATDNEEGTKDFSFFNPPLDVLAALTEEDFRRLFAQSPIKRAKYRGWLRNLCVAMGNSGDPRFIPWLEKARHHSDAIVLEHAQWALKRLGAARTK